MDDTRQEPPSLERLRQRDPDAFTWLVNHHQILVLRLGQAMGLHGANLEDAAADVFDNVYRALPTFEGRSPLQTWLYRVAVRTLARFRSRQKSQAIAELPQEIPDHAQRAPDERLEKREVNERIWAAVARLGPRQAMAVELHYRQGYSVEDTAELMGCPAGTVKTLLFRSREQLRMWLRNEGLDL